MADLNPTERWTKEGTRVSNICWAFTVCQIFTYILLKVTIILQWLFWGALREETEMQKLRDLPKITYSVGHRTWIWTEICVTPKFTASPLHRVALDLYFTSYLQRMIFYIAGIDVSNLKNTTSI